MRRSTTLAVLLLLVAQASCASPLGEAPSRQPQATVAPSALGEPPDDSAASVVTAYGGQHADQYAGVYFERPGGKLVALFTEDVTDHQQALDALLGGAGRVTVRGATFPEQMLIDILDRISASQQVLQDGGISFISGGVDTIGNVVDVVAKSDDPIAEAVLRSYGPAGAIVVQLYPADKPWTQPDGGSGWRSLGVFDTGLFYTVYLAIDDAQLSAAWELYGLTDPLPAFDPDTEVVAFLSYGIGSSCPEMRLDAVILDADERLVYGETSDPYDPRACTADLVGAKTFVVALQRALLPPSPFTLRLGRERIGCDPDCGIGPSEIQVDLG